MENQPRISPARAHFMRVQAAQEAAKASEDNPLENATGHELMLAKLGQDKHRLKSVQSLEKKLDLKREILPEYGPYIEGVLAGGNGAQDSVFMTLLVWQIDVGNLEVAYLMALYAIEHKLAPADHYQRTTACLIAEEIADTALKVIDADGKVNIQILCDVRDLVADQDMPDEVRAKLFKAIGFAVKEIPDGDDVALNIARKQSALEALNRALQLHEKAGVKKAIGELERDIKNATPAP